jgi:hypothetical protein
MQAETELVLSLCRTPIPDTLVARATDILRGGKLRWESVFDLAAFWEVEPVVMSNLRRHFPEIVSPDVLARAEKCERDARAIALSRTLMSIDLVQKLDAVGIESILLKGPAIGQLAYGDASFRTFADIDLLVRREDLSRARDFLLKSGYSPEYKLGDENQLVLNQHALEFAKSGTKVELHWSLLSRHLSLNFDLDRIWSKSITVECAGRKFRTLARSDLFLFLSAHGAKHEWERVRWICDLVQLEPELSELEVNEVIDLAGEMNARRILALGLYLSRSLLGPVQSRVSLERIPFDDETESLVNLVVNARVNVGSQTTGARAWFDRLDPHLRPLVFWSRARERRYDQIASFLRVFFIPTEKDSGPRAVRWVARPLRLARRVGRTIFARQGQGV